MRPGDEGGKAPARHEEAQGGAAHDQPQIDPYRMDDDAPDRLCEILLDEILKAQEVIVCAGLPLVRLGFDGPGCALAAVGALRPGYGGRYPVEPREAAQLGAEHAVVL